MTRHDDIELDSAPRPAGPQRRAVSHLRGGLRLRHLGAVAGLRCVGQGPHRLGRPGRAVPARHVGAGPGRAGARHPRRPHPPQTPPDLRRTCCLAALLLTLLTVDSPTALWLLFAVLFVYGATGVVHDAAESALVAAAVPAALLGDFNGLRMTATEGMKLLAPLPGAGLYAAYGGGRVALLDAVTFVLAAGLCSARLRVHERAGLSRPPAPGGHGPARRRPPPAGPPAPAPAGPGGRRHDVLRRAQRRR